MKKLNINIKTFFHYLSYLQYPLATTALYFVSKPYFADAELIEQEPLFIFECINNMLIFLGLTMSFATLQDTTKTSFKFEKLIYENPQRGKMFILYLFVLTMLVLCPGIYGYFYTDIKELKEISFGAIVLAIGLIGVIKTAIEIFENHRLDKNS